MMSDCFINKREPKYEAKQDEHVIITASSEEPLISVTLSIGSVSPAASFALVQLVSQSLLSTT